MSVESGRSLYDEMHTRAKDRPKADLPKRGAKGIAAGRALYDNECKRAAIDVQVGEEGTAV